MSKVPTAEYEKSPAKEKIIVALDVETADKAREIVKELRGEVGAFKIGLQLFTAVGASFVKETIASGSRVFLDLKFHDIPNTVANASIEAARLGVWMFNVHALGGSEMMRKTVEEVRGICEKENLIRPKIIAVTILTSSGAKTLKEIGIEKGTDEQVLNLARLAANCGMDGVVASPLEVESIRRNIDKMNFLIVTPGIRSLEFKVQSSEFAREKLNAENKSEIYANQFETYEDQKRVMTSGNAARVGSDYLVIGRPILQAKNKILAVREIVKEIEKS